MTFNDKKAISMTQVMAYVARAQLMQSCVGRASEIEDLNIQKLRHETRKAKEDSDGGNKRNRLKEEMMEMLEAMEKCLPGGYVARKAYPNRKYFKDENGIVSEAVKVDFIDFISRDWEQFPAHSKNVCHCNSDEIQTEQYGSKR